MKASPLRLCALCLAPLVLLGAASQVQPAAEHGAAAAEPGKTAVKVEYLEIVTPAVAETCKALADQHGVVFSEPVAALGNARTADLKNGGRIGVRAPMAEHETPVVRPYLLVDDIEAAVKAAEAAGAQVAMPPTEIPGQGTFAIYLLGGIQHGLWRDRSR